MNLQVFLLLLVKWYIDMYLLLIIGSFVATWLGLKRYSKRKIYLGPVGKIIKDFSSNPDNWATDLRRSSNNGVYLHKDGFIAISVDGGTVKYHPKGLKIGETPNVFLDEIQMTKIQRAFCEQVVKNKNELLKKQALEAKLDNFKNLVNQTIVEEINPKEVEKSPSSDMKIPAKIQKKIDDFGTM